MLYLKETDKFEIFTKLLPKWPLFLKNRQVDLKKNDITAKHWENWTQSFKLLQF